MKKIPPKERLIFALDVPDREKGVSLVKTLGDAVILYKLGLELFMSGEYFPFVQNLVGEWSKKVFCDLKFFDVPATVERTVLQLRKHKASFVTIHAQSRKVTEAAARAKNGVKVLGVTVLTSIDEADLKTSGIDIPLIEVVKRRAKAAIDAGCDGLICAGTDVEEVRKTVGDEPILVCPGIRPSGKVSNDDQKRICTPSQAIKNGADYIVVGRPIRDAKDPRAAALAIQEEIASTL